jgi:hypothetical protein
MFIFHAIINYYHCCCCCCCCCFCFILQIITENDNRHIKKEFTIEVIIHEIKIEVIIHEIKISLICLYETYNTNQCSIQIGSTSSYSVKYIINTIFTDQGFMVTNSSTEYKLFSSKKLMSIFLNFIIHVTLLTH